jgi:hypothetical protein
VHSTTAPPRYSTVFWHKRCSHQHEIGAANCTHIHCNHKLSIFSDAGCTSQTHTVMSINGMNYINIALVRFFLKFSGTALNNNALSIFSSSNNRHGALVKPRIFLIGSCGGLTCWGLTCWGLTSILMKTFAGRSTCACIHNNSHPNGGEKNQWRFLLEPIRYRQVRDWYSLRSLRYYVRSGQSLGLLCMSCCTCKIYYIGSRSLHGLLLFKD